MVARHTRSASARVSCRYTVLTTHYAGKRHSAGEASKRFSNRLWRLVIGSCLYKCCKLMGSQVRPRYAEWTCSFSENRYHECDRRPQLKQSRVESDYSTHSLFTSLALGMRAVLSPSGCMRREDARTDTNSLRRRCPATLHLHFWRKLPLPMAAASEMTNQPRSGRK